MNRPIYVGDVPIVTDKLFRERDKDDFYETDIDCLRTYFDTYFEGDIDNCSVLDPGAGTGVYGRVLREYFPNALIVGVEKNGDRFPRPSLWYDIWHETDYLTLPDNPHFHYVTGNPPYKHAEAFFHKSLSMLYKRTGTIDFLLRLGFLESERRYYSMWSNGYRPTRVTILNTRPSFTGNGKTYPAAFAFFQWEVKDGRVKESSIFDFMTFERKVKEDDTN